MSLDLVFENARIVDGSGAPWFRGAVGVEDGRIAAVSRRADHGLSADEAVDAGGSIVCPGFIDVHSHSALQVFEDPTLAPKTRQGITTEIVGQDGFSMAPIYREGGAEEWRRHLASLAGGVDPDWWTWGSTAGYLDAIDDRGPAANFAMLVGHGTVRYNVLGMADDEPTDADLDEMGDLVTEALEEGAIGFSTGLVYPPQVHSDTREVRELASRLAPYGRPFFAHIRNQGRWIWEAIDEFVSIGAEEDIPLHYSHLGMYGNRFNHGQADRAIELVETARDRGVDITADHHFYTAGSTMLQAILPPWLQAHDPDEMLELLRDEEVRERVNDDIEGWRYHRWENYAMRNGWENTVITSVTTEANKGLEGRTIAEIAAERGEDPAIVACDVLVEEELGVTMIQHSLADEDVRTVLGSERVAVGSDGIFGDNPHPRTYGTFPQVLGTYAREDNELSVEEAVRKMTSLPARAMGLQSKGLVRPGMDADLVVFDPALVRSPATYDHPEQYPKGIPHVVVNGEFVVRDGEITGERPGGAIRA